MCSHLRSARSRLDDVASLREIYSFKEEKPMFQRACLILALSTNWICAQTLRADSHEIALQL